MSDDVLERLDEVAGSVDSLLYEAYQEIKRTRARLHALRVMRCERCGAVGTMMPYDPDRNIGNPVTDVPPPSQ